MVPPFVETILDKHRYEFMIHFGFGELQNDPTEVSEIRKSNASRKCLLLEGTPIHTDCWRRSLN